MRVGDQRIFQAVIALLPRGEMKMVVKAVKARTKIGPQHQGHKMSLRAYEFVEVQEGYLYELARGYIVVSEVANYYHASQIDVIQNCLHAYRAERKGAISEFWKLAVPS
jgi:hypothetical protein